MANLENVIEMIEKLFLKWSIKKNLKDINIRRLEVLPSINKINVYFNGIDDRKRLDSFIDIMSSALPRYYVAKQVYYQDDELILTISYEKLYESSQFIINDVNEFIDMVNCGSYSELIFDKEVVWNLDKYPHLLVTGSTGSGKTYFVNGLILQALIKNYDVTVLDVKQTYTQFESLCDVKSVSSSIMMKMRDLESELFNRQEIMKEHLKYDSNLIASKCQLHNRLIIVEEYIALSALLSKKELVEFERILTMMTVMGRQLGFHVIVVSQLALANTISSNIRSNLSKVAMRCTDESILKTTFGLSTSCKILKKDFKVGEGLVCLDSNILIFRGMKFNVQISDIIDIIKKIKRK